MLKRFFLLLSSLLLVCNVQAGLFNNKPQYLTAAEAFIFSSSQQDGQLQLHWQIADGYYLYQKEIQLSAQNATLGDVTFPTAEKYQDEFFGEVAIFRDQLKLPVKLTDLKENPSLKIRYQGCTKGFCYPPETVVIPLNPSLQGNNSANSAALPSTIATPNAPQTELAENLSNNYLSIFGFLLLGIGLAFTPCVLPMLPLLSAIVIGHKNRPNTSRALLLSFTYVQGMALTYTLLGLTVAAIGLPFQVALQSPAVLISLAVLFTLLAASMFGLFEIRLPNTWQQKLNALSQQQQGGAVGNVFIMGIIAGLVASPCTSAPLSGALLYVAQSGNLLIGGLALYLLALGMGLPLILITVFGNQILPKSGEWLFKVKTAFGFVMLALPIFLISRILPSHYEPFLWSTLALAFLGWLISSLNYSTMLKQAVRILLFIAFGLTAYPWANLVWQTTSNTAQPTTPHLAMEKITSLTELEQKLTAYQGKKVMLDLYADWCVACKEFEKYTFTDPQVQQQLATMAVLQIDMTKNSAENTALMKHFNVLGLPTILFFDENGHEMTNVRITGFLTANQFLAWLNRL
ncbi:protein-disulfide reductase DsbD [[Haemophilus] ducreyi]|uniref:Thiol:disulfide interchange protein DsbD n=2 Tax=Haemophilus ducreyi TaxID=730 RepID=DSBD_HAEDU|nr:protein-disulfide reductase DsbD [[Haemophilus] ducreyi]Q7VMZ4.1 RecName: Full=Thiol:disulfide interchange protein DsbD; AltName: Full=Protein-disulfide reductase; Short=Disulfide reductase; Flags: Precursor [[Haemophilus] ducreyi 35000HP]AAP95707.1 thiol:disulfide interchange protein [[Haemophilus] ducreyi 35000HP]AKO30767.1 thiol:disulfide interchange protein [[Haemophilus] ducreyi]AKO32205.1 thiol:disulfide interchange protein [[Haemophilus] ducreyi]AKO33659.1 thiol:disulfide interchange